MDEIRYPIGAFELPKEITQKHITTYIEELRRFPYLLEEAVKQCPPNILNLTYREGGWTIAQIVHHLADVDMNSFIRPADGVSEGLNLMTCAGEWIKNSQTRNSRVMIFTKRI